MAVAINVLFIICVFALAVSLADVSVRKRRNVGTCGVSKISTGLIVQGKDTRRGEFPWIVVLMTTKTESPTLLGSGTLISSTFLVTAAHCIQPKYGTKILAQEVIAVFGVYKLDDPFEVERIVVVPEKIIVHEDWNTTDQRYDADMSLLKFEERKISIEHTYINPICIWDSIDDLLLGKGIILGWGQSDISTKQRETVPKQTEIEMVSAETCFSEDYHEAYYFSRRMFCAGNIYVSTPCTGDSGGGLFIKVDGIYYLKGLFSANLVGNGGNCDISSYSLYTDITQFTDWIMQKTQGAFATSAKALKDVFCTFRLKFSFHLAQRIQTCVVEPNIDSDFFVIASEPNDSVISFAIHNKRSARFIPRFIGEKFSNLEELTAHKRGLSIIRSFYFDNMRNVRYVDLSFNQIAVVEKGSFKDLFSVKYLFLGNNRIETLDKELFKVMVNLKNLDLAHNKLRSLDPATFKIRGGKMLEANLVSNVCLNATYEPKEFVELERRVRSDCKPE